LGRYRKQTCTNKSDRRKEYAKTECTQSIRRAYKVRCAQESAPYAEQFHLSGNAKGYYGYSNTKQEQSEPHLLDKTDAGKKDRCRKGGRNGEREMMNSDLISILGSC